MDKMHVRWVKESKHSKVKQLTMEAQLAFQHHDSFRLYHAISRFCPRQKTKRTHLRNAAGELLTPTEETATYVQFITDHWKGPPIVMPDFPTTIPSTKSVVPGFAPGSMWKSQSMLIAEWLMKQLCIWWNQNPPHIPQTWRDACACWLPKPHKQPTKLENLRMLGLQEPLGKAVLKLVAKKALYQTLQWLGKYPQYALQSSIPREWLLENIIIFADDIHVHCMFHDVSELAQAVHFFELIIDAIERLGLQLSPSKSCVITRGKGPGYAKWKRTHTCVWMPPKYITSCSEMATWRFQWRRRACTWESFFPMTNLNDKLLKFGFKRDGKTSNDCNHGYAENIRSLSNSGWS